MGSTLNLDLQGFIRDREAEFGQISDDRKALLERLSEYVKMNGENEVSLNFICTHNSRRSHLAQIWASAAALHYGVDRINTFSGGTEATELNANIAVAVQKSGIELTNPGGDNPKYVVRFSEQDEPLICFSKKYDDPPNPTSNFGAIMTCSHADENCPMILGADFRLALTYSDPKISDGTPQQEHVYLERCKEIAREMLYVFSKAR